MFYLQRLPCKGSSIERWSLCASYEKPKKGPAFSDYVFLLESDLQNVVTMLRHNLSFISILLLEVPAPCITAAFSKVLRKYLGFKKRI